MTDQQIPTQNNPMRIGFENSGAVFVKRVSRRSQMAKAMEVAGVREGDTASQLRFTLLMMRLGVVDAEGLEDPESGKAVPFKTKFHPALKAKLATEEVVDAIPEEHYPEVMAGVLGGHPDEYRDEDEDAGELTGAQRGN